MLILAEWTENYKEHFTPLVARLRERHRGEKVCGLLYQASFVEPEDIISIADPFDDILVIAGPKALASALRDDRLASVTYVLVKHFVSPAEGELCRVIKQLTPTPIFLLRNDICLAKYLESGVDQKPEIEALLRTHRRREIEIISKVYLVYALEIIFLFLLRIPALLRKTHHKHKIIFIRLDVMGDMILSLPALLAIRERFPDSEITVLASKRSGAIIEEQHKISPGRFCDHLYYWEAPWHRPEHKEKLLGTKALFQLLKGVSTLFFERFDIVLQPVELGAGVLFSTLLLGKVTIASIAERLPLACLLKRHVEPVILPFYQLYHIADLPNFVAAKCGAKPSKEHRHNVLTVASEELESIAQRFKSLGWDGSSQIIAINIGAGHPKRQWSPNKYAALMEMLLGRVNTFPVLLGGVGEIELKKLIVEASSVILPDVVGELNLNQLIAALSISEVVVTPDTGVMHMAAALNKKIVALFGAGLVPFCEPLCDTYAIVKHELGCSGCGDKCFVEGEAPCISLISVVEVLEAVSGILPAN